MSTGETIFNDTSSAGGASIVNASAELDFDGDIGRTIFNGASTADHASISNYGAGGSHGAGGQTIFNDTSTAANASIDNGGSGEVSTAESALTTFNDTSTAGHATITNDGGFDEESFGGVTVFQGSSTADSATLIANRMSGGGGGAILFNDASTGGTARVKVFGNGYLDISGHQSGVTVGSIEGSGNVLLGANNLRVGTNEHQHLFLRRDLGKRFADQGRQRSIHVASQPLHRGHRRSHSGKRLDYQPRLCRGSRRNRLFNGQRRFATAGNIWRSNEQRPTYPT